MLGTTMTGKQVTVIVGTKTGEVGHIVNVYVPHGSSIVHYDVLFADGSFDTLLTIVSFKVNHP